ncbi:MAG: VanZ family protein [Myxococcales bacterium]|nr:VanZ family protein [Myxococcales bacterium]MCB9625789.1 VanZ family protein [Sandaracinaceae bacterium]
MTLIFVLSSFHIQPQVIEELPFKDKLVHTIEFALLGGLCVHAARRTWPRHATFRTALLGVFLATAFGVTDELHQSFVPGRSAELLDIGADALGASLGALVTTVWGWRRRARE